MPYQFIVEKRDDKGNVREVVRADVTDQQGPVLVRLLMQEVVNLDERLTKEA